MGGEDGASAPRRKVKKNRGGSKKRSNQKRGLTLRRRKKQMLRGKQGALSGHEEGPGSYGRNKGKKKRVQMWHRRENTIRKKRGKEEIKWQPKRQRPKSSGGGGGGPRDSPPAYLGKR